MVPATCAVFHKALLKVGAEVRIARGAATWLRRKAPCCPAWAHSTTASRLSIGRVCYPPRAISIASGRPFLGICVGYQALFERSEEFNSCAAGLGIFRGKVVRFSGANGLKVPQIGWNQLEEINPACPIYAGVPEGSYVYFVHSFYPQPADAGIVASRTRYGETFPPHLAGQRVSTQFHPEKGDVGLRLLGTL
jgi:glutamine amidotransferase